MAIRDSDYSTNGARKHPTTIFIIMSVVMNRKKAISFCFDFGINWLTK
jgi:hypothetical protein